MLRRSPKRIWQTLLGVFVTAIIGWIGSLVGDCLHWSMSVNNQLAQAAEERAVIRTTEDLHWGAVNTTLNSIDHRLDHIENRVDRIPDYPEH